jgi:hypothetical protein
VEHNGEVIMPSEKEIEEAMSRHSDEIGLYLAILREAYLSMKSERNKYKEIVERIANLENNTTEFMRNDLAVAIAKEVLSLRDKKEE